MNSALAVKTTDTVNLDAIQGVLLRGDLSKLSAEQRLQYYNQVCQTVGLNPLTKPFDYMTLQGREVLYANKGCAEQLRSLHRISIRIAAREKIDDVYVVTAEASGPDGRVDSSTGAVPLSNLKGDALANAMMKAETKAKRRVTLSICGLNMLDETEIETIKRPNQILADQPGPEDGDPGRDPGYTIPFGKFGGRRLEDVMLDDLRSYVEYIEKKAAKEGKPVTGKVRDFIERAEAYLGAMESAPLEPGEAG